MFRKQIVYFLTVTAIFTSALAQGDIGDSCVIKNTGAQGICKAAHDCPQATEQAKRGVRPEVCGFQVTALPIFCCEVSSSIQPNENSFLNVDNSDGFIFPESVAPVQQIFSSKSEEKCTEYSKLVTSTVNAVPLITEPEQISVNIAKCDKSVALIVGGSPADAGEFPFMAAVGYNDESEIGWYCGGTLISDYYVVTAAHCANTKFYGPPVKVRLGEVDLKKEDENSVYVDYNIADIKIHEQYRPPARYNDIALFKLASKVEFTEFIRPTCLWTKSSFESTKTIAAGWGKTGIAEDQSNRLLKVTLNILDNSLCTKSYPPHVRTLPRGIQPSMMCAGELKGGKDTCQGDSGGPLIVTRKTNQCVFYIVGITSFGKGCGGPNLPAVYTRISEYIPWIENIIW